jgi:acyl carrier protein
VLLEFCDPSGVALCPSCGHLLRRLQGRLASLYGAPAGIKLGTSFLDDLGADSLDLAELIMELEEEFDVTIPDVAVEQIRTVEDALRCIERHLDRKRSESGANAGRSRD